MPWALLDNLDEPIRQRRGYVFKSGPRYTPRASEGRGPLVYAALVPDRGCGARGESVGGAVARRTARRPGCARLSLVGLSGRSRSTCLAARRSNNWGCEQRGARYAVIVQADEFLDLGTTIVAPTSASAPRDHARRAGDPGPRRADTVVDPRRLGRSAGRLEANELRAVDDAFRLLREVLDCRLSVPSSTLPGRLRSLAPERTGSRLAGAGGGAPRLPGALIPRAGRAAASHSLLLDARTPRPAPRCSAAARRPDPAGRAR